MIDRIVGAVTGAWDALVDWHWRHKWAFALPWVFALGMVFVKEVVLR